MTCATSEDSDQPAHSRILIRVFDGRMYSLQAIQKITLALALTLTLTPNPNPNPNPNPKP